MRRMLCLDGVRGGLAFYVLLGHALPFAPFPAWVHWLFQHGGAAVDVFFILSGLVIGTVARGFQLSRAAIPDRPGGADLSRVPGGVRAVPDGAAVGHRLRAHALAWTRQSGALHLVRRLAEELGHRHHHTPDDDAWLVPKQCVAGCLGRVPRCRVEPFDRMAVLSVRAVDRRTTGTDANGLVVPGAVAGGARMADGRT